MQKGTEVRIESLEIRNRRHLLDVLDRNLLVFQVRISPGTYTVILQKGEIPDPKDQRIEELEKALREALFSANFCTAAEDGGRGCRAAVNQGGTSCGCVPLRDRLSKILEGST